MATLDINNVVTITVTNPPAGLAGYQVNNLLYCTKETPIASITDYAVYRSPTAVATDWGSASETYEAAARIFAQSPNILTGGGSLIIRPMAGGDTLTAAITTMMGLAFFGGVCYGGYAPNDAEIIAAATTAQANRKLLFVSQHAATVLDTGNLYRTLHTAAQPYCRKLLYTTSATEARKMACAYASRLLSVNFAGSNTVASVHLKELSGVTIDDGITQTILTGCATYGADVYVDIGGLPKVFCSNGGGLDLFADQAYCRMWLANALSVAGFNALATTNTKVPQTEAGVDILKGAYLNVLEQAVANGYLAPGTWNGADRFGDPEDFLRTIASYGYYVYSQPVSQQSQVDREARKAPLIQIAGKEAGAIHSTDVLVFVEA